MNEVFSQTINQYYVWDDGEESGSLNAGMMHLEHALGTVKPNFWFAITDFETTASIGAEERLNWKHLFPIEVKPPRVFKTTKRESIKERFEEESHSEPIYQLMSYMTSSNCKYGVLTTVAQTWIFRKENDVFYVSSAMPRTMWLKTIYYACYMSKKYYDENPDDRPGKNKAQLKESPNTTHDSWPNSNISRKSYHFSKDCI